MGCPLPTIAAIQSAVAAEFGLPVAIMKEPDGIGVRQRDKSHPRQLAMCLSVRLTQHSYARIGQFFGGRDHSTVREANRRVEKRRLSDPTLHNAMRRITLELVRR